MTATTVLPVARELFVPEVIWVPAEGGYRAVDRAEEPETWLAAVAADEPVVIQVDDGATPPGQFGARSSSSSSQPSLVAAMLDAAGLAPGMRVLEIGTGTGWTAALLAHRLGDAAVTTVEVDAAVAEHARATLDRAGFHPTVIVGDGAAGCVERAPFDRVLATCAVAAVPDAWVAQTRPGGLVLTPWGTEYHNGALARLMVDKHGAAAGRFAPVPLAFMRLRAQRADTCPWEGDGPGDGTPGLTHLSSREVYELIAVPGAFAVGLRMPGCHKLVDEDNLIVRVHDPSSGSWARCDVTPGPGPHPIAQHGPRRLWDELEAAHTWWAGLGRPGLDRFGLTVTRDAQRVWLDEPTKTVPCG